MVSCQPERGEDHVVRDCDNRSDRLRRFDGIYVLPRSRSSRPTLEPVEVPFVPQGKQAATL